MVNTFLAKRREERNRTSMQRKLGVATPGFPKDKTPGPKKGTCQQWWKNGTCSRGDKCSYNRPEGVERRTLRTPKRQSRPSTPRSGNTPPGTPSSKGKGRGKSRSNSPRGTSPSGKRDTPCCRFYIRGLCNNGENCEFNHPATCIHWRKKACTEGRKCKYLHAEIPKHAAPAKPPSPETKAKAEPAKEKSGKALSKGSPSTPRKAKGMPAIAIPFMAMGLLNTVL